MHEIYYNQDGRGSDEASISRIKDSVPRNPPSSSPSAQSASASKVASTSLSASALASTPPKVEVKAGAATEPEPTPKVKVSIRPLDRKAYLAGRDVIRKIHEKLHRETVSHRGHLKKVRSGWESER